jgi:hypothetical protein
MTSAQDEQKERVRVLLQDNWLRNRDLREDVRLDNERKNLSTLGQFTAAELAESDSGRFAKKIEVVGQKRETNYPALPPTSPWSSPDPSGLEPPFPIDISEPPIVGEHFEIERSLSSTRRVGGDVAASDGDDAAKASPASSLQSDKKSASGLSPISAGTGAVSRMKRDAAPSPLTKRKL